MRNIFQEKVKKKWEPIENKGAFRYDKRSPYVYRTREDEAFARDVTFSPCNLLRVLDAREFEIE